MGASNLVKGIMKDYLAAIDKYNPVAEMISVAKGEVQYVKNRKVWPPQAMQYDAKKWLASRRVPALKSLEIDINPNASPEDWVRAIQKAKAEALAGHNNAETARMRQAASRLVLDAPALDAVPASEKNGHD